jgi:hypothetical protein
MVRALTPVRSLVPKLLIDAMIVLFCSYRRGYIDGAYNRQKGHPKKKKNFLSHFVL